MKRFVGLALLAGLMFGCQTYETNLVLDRGDDVELENVQQNVDVAEESVEELASAAKLSAPIEIEKERTSMKILMKTSKGDMTIELDAEKAPKTVANFLAYVESGHYNGTIFHRVIDNFMIQGGGFDADMNQKNAPNTVENEAANGLKNGLGSIAMARTSDPHSASAQFFINVSNNAFLDYPGQDGWGYCVFGQVIEGMDVANAIKGVPTAAQDVPRETVEITEVVVVED